MDFSDKTLWEYHIKEAKRRAVPLRPSLEIATGIVIDKLLDENCKEVKIPAEIDGVPVNRIGKRAFMNCKQLESVEIPDTVLVIEEEAFAGCERLAKISMPPYLRKMMRGIFRNCTGLTEAEFPDGLITISFETFYGCTSLKKVKLPERLVLLGNQVFKGCVSLETVELPERLEKIEQEAFGGCKALKELRIPDSVRKISGWAFEGCSSLKEISLPEGITKIEQKTFKECSSLRRIQIPASVVNIGTDRLNWITAMDEENIGKVVQNNPLEDCENLREICVYAGSYAQEWATENGYRALFCVEELPLDYSVDKDTRTVSITGMYSRRMEHLIIPGIIESCYVTQIAKEAFASCDNLTGVEIPEPVQVIGKGAFSMCSNLHSIKLPASIEQIDETALTGCTELKRIYAPVDSYAEYWATEHGFEVIYCS